MTISKTMHIQPIKTERTDCTVVASFSSSQVSSAASGSLSSVQIQLQNGSHSIHPVTNGIALRNNNTRLNLSSPLAGSHALVNDTNQNSSRTQEKSQNLENLVDFPSIKGLFGWTTVDDVNIPYILRHDKRFVSVRIVEMKLLGRYPNSYPDELGKHKPLTSFFITHNEARLLNEINLVHCGGEYGSKEFTQKDLIVLLSDFIEFHNIVKKTFPERNTPNQNTKTVEEKELFTHCGWLQINNTVTPYVKRPSGKYVPFSVIRYAAGLMTSENDILKGVLPTQIECDLMNKACMLAGFNFNFAKTTRIIALTDILQTNFVHVTELPMENPLSRAHYMALSANKQSSGAHCDPNRSNSAYPNQPISQNTSMQLPHINIPLDQTQQGSINGNMRNIPTHNLRPPPPYPGIFNPRVPFMTPFNGFQSFPGMSQPNPMSNFAHVPPNAGLRPHVSSGPGSPIDGIQRPMLLPNILQQSQVQFQGGGGLNRPQTSPHPCRPRSSTDLNKRFPGQANGFLPSPEFRPLPGHHSSLFPAAGNVRNPAVQRNVIQSQQMNPQFRMPVTTQPNSGQSTRAPASFSSGMMTEIQSWQQHAKSMQQVNNIRTSVVTCQSYMPPVTNTQQKSMPPSSSTNIVSSLSGLYNPSRQQTVQKRPTNSAGIGGPPPLLMMAPILSNVSQSTSKTISSTNRSEGAGHKKQDTSIIDLANTSVQTSQDVGAKEKALKIGADYIKGAWLNGKSISCLHIETPERKGRYCLVEAVCKLYFNGCSVNEFLFALENVLNVSLLSCTDEEEKAFIHYYNLPVTVLKCNKVISFDDLNSFFPQLSYMFPEKPQTADSSSTIGNLPDFIDPSSSFEGSNIPTSESAGLLAIQLGSDLQFVNGHSTFSSSGSEKRLRSSHDQGPDVKQAKLHESAIQKLRNHQLEGGKIDDSGSNQRHQSNKPDSVIVLD
ncbi:hypothetical protein CHS0354_003170 [Potamilus streckersoni]|uniref:Uncharacterized protein n=1 Tax=Potamilus streckersoni TaxID=2493646 RepID=A0AAE0TGF1_9BIVA|nr:hypothetical protein CHS0354_003170 [Potamilus streckersoni]